MLKDYVPFRVLSRTRYNALKRARDEAIRICGELQRSQRRLTKFAQLLAGANGTEFSRLTSKSRSQFGQDLFVLARLQIKRGGFFVEFGATDGLTFNNTYLLERELGWTGILAEPARCWHEALRNNRSSKIDIRGVWSESGKTLTFNETQTSELSTIDQFSESDLHHEKRKNGQRYEIETVSLTDLLKAHGAPGNIDYLSIDTEGSEFEILKGFDFQAYSFSVITCEHNYTDNRKDVFDLLTSKGYSRVFEDMSEYDDWYVRD